MTDPSPQPAADPLDEELIAYLDGELDEPKRIEVEQRLAAEEEYRRRLRSLERAWDMLDLLPTAQASDDFTRSTVEMTIETAADEAQTQQLRTRQSRRKSMLIGGAALVVAAAAGYAAVMVGLDSENRQLVRDLPVIESVDQYRTVENVEFLHRLVDEGLFAEPEGEVDNAY